MATFFIDKKEIPTFFYHDPEQRSISTQLLEHGSFVGGNLHHCRRCTHARCYCNERHSQSQSHNATRLYRHRPFVMIFAPSASRCLNAGKMCAVPLRGLEQDLKRFTTSQPQGLSSHTRKSRRKDRTAWLG
jgi:hypothetical protein